MLYTVVDYALLLVDSILAGHVICVTVGNKNRKMKWVFIAVYYLVIATKSYLVAATSVLNTTAQTMTPIIVTILLISAIYKVGIVKATVLSFVYNVFVVLIQVISYFLILVFEKAIGGAIPEKYFSNMVQIIYMLIVLLILCKCKEILKKMCDTLYRYLDSKDIILLKSVKIIISCALTAGMIYFSIKMFDYLGKRSSTVALVCLAMLVMMVILVITYYEIAISQTKARDADERAKMNKIHDEFVYKMNKFGHSFNNLMQTMWILVNCEGTTLEDIRPVVNDILHRNKDDNIGNNLRFINLPNMLAASILSIKMEKAEELNVNLMLEYDGMHKDISMNSKDFIDMFNILLDNSIEAAHYAENKNVEIALHFGEDKFSLKIINRYAIDVCGAIMKYGDSKGIGLQNIEEIVNCNKNIIMDKEMNDGVFTITIDVNNRKFDRGRYAK